MSDLELSLTLLWFTTAVLLGDWIRDLRRDVSDLKGQRDGAQRIIADLREMLRKEPSHD